MLAMAEETVEEWTKKATLGHGGFGVVNLWLHKNTKHTLALKKCRWDNDPVITPKLKERWQMEVDIMKKLDHVNVVRALDVPEELDVAEHEMPVLAMEYCSGGDLRKVLNDPENCCGLQESAIRRMTRDIGSAIEYLHSRHIIHRDLKPENIVLQNADGKIIYKLIDLGYAKEMDNSLCSSFVGTLQYLAPELFMSLKYSLTVDYWSFGLVTHECIVGFRPFLPRMSPAEWMEAACLKKSDDICIYKSFDNDKVCYSKHLCKENYLSEEFTRLIEKWLRVMLKWDPQERGVIQTGNKEINIGFSLLDDILQAKIVRVFCVPTGRNYSYVVSESTSTRELCANVARDSQIPIEDLLFLLPRGLPPDFEKNALQCWRPLEEEVDENEGLLFVFSKSNHHETNIQFKLDSVDRIIRDKNAEVDYETKKKMWAHCVYWVRQISSTYNRLLQGHRILMLHLLFRNSEINKIKTKLSDEMKRLETHLEIMQKSAEVDKKQYENVKLFSCRKLESMFQFTDSAKEVGALKQKAMEAIVGAGVVGTKTIELQRSPYARASQTSPLETWYKQTLQLYEELRLSKDQKREKPANHCEMAKVLCEFLRSKNELFNRVFTHFDKLLSCSREAAEAMHPLQTCIEECTKLSANLSDLTTARQELIWKAIDHLAKKVANKDSNQNKSLACGEPFPSEQKVSLQPPNASNSYRSLASCDGVSLSAIINETSEDSTSAVSMNHDLRLRIQEQFVAMEQSLPYISGSNSASSNHH